MCRTVASYLGHADATMTLNTYANVGPNTKRAAVSKVEGAFDVAMTRVVDEMLSEEEPEAPAAVTFTVEQLDAMLAMAKRAEGAVQP